MRGRFVIVRRGITRTVWLIGRWAIKFPSLRRYGRGLAGLLWSITRGIQANLAEAEWSRNADPRDALCPVRWSLAGIVNVYPRCAPYPEHLPVPPSDLPLGDDKHENWGLLATPEGPAAVRVDYDSSYNGCPHDFAGRRVRP